MAYIEDYEESKNIYEGVSNKEDARYLLSYLNEVLIPASQDFFGSLGLCCIKPLTAELKLLA